MEVGEVVEGVVVILLGAVLETSVFVLSAVTVSADAPAIALGLMRSFILVVQTHGDSDRQILLFSKPI